jgi:hypothetical protein
MLKTKPNYTEASVSLYAVFPKLSEHIVEKSVNTVVSNLIPAALKN